MDELIEEWCEDCGENLVDCGGMCNQEETETELFEPIEIDPDQSNDPDYLMEEVIFPIIILGDNEPQLMSASRLHCINHKMELGIYDIITVRDEERLYMIQDKEGTTKYEMVKGEEKEGKTVSSMIVGKRGYHHKDKDPLKCIPANFVGKEKKVKKKANY